MKKLLVATDFFYPHWTGISKAFFHMTQALQKEFDVTVITVQHDKTLPLKEQYETISIIRSPFAFTLSRAKYSFAIIKDFFKIIKTQDIVLINSPCTNILFFSVITKLFNKKLYIFHQGDLILPAGFLNTLIELIFDIMTYCSALLADKVSTYTNDYAQHSRTLKPFLSKFTPLLMPIGFKPPTTPIIEPVDTITRLKNNGHIVYGFAGRFVYEKGFDLLFKAIPSIIKQLPNAHFVFAGELHMGYEDFFDQHKDSYEKVKKHITILGLLHGDQLMHFYTAVDTMIVPSRSDCFNLVQAEAMLCKTPVLFTDIPGGRMLVKTTGFGLLFEKENVEALADAVVEMHTKHEELQNNWHNAVAFLDDYANTRKIIEFLNQ